MKVRAPVGLLAVACFVLPAALHAEPVRLAPFSEATGETGSAAERAYQAGLAALAAGDPAGAERAFRDALKRDPSHAASMLGLAELAFGRRRLDEAERLIQEAVKAEPKSAHAHASLGRLRAIQGRALEAQAALRRAVALDGTLVRARMDLGDLSSGVPGGEKEALEQYRAVLDLDPKHAGAHYALGVVLTRLGQYPEARAALEHSARLDPANPLPALGLANLALAQQDLQGALREVNRALALQPALAGALELRGDIRQGLREDERAAADYEAALKSEPARASALVKHGMLHQRLGRRDEARKAYLAAIKVNPRLSIAYNNLAWMALEAGGPLEQAEGWSRQAVKLAPEVADFHDTLGWIHRARGRREEAERVLRHATKLKNASASTFYHLGVVLEEQGKKDAALTAFKRALVLDPRHKDAAEAIARF